MMRLPIHRFALLLPVLTVGCTDAERTGDMADSMRVEGDRADAGQSLSMDTVVASVPADGMQTIAMNPLGDSGISGEATVMPGSAVGTNVRVTLQGASDGSHQGHIHEGTCAQIGGVVAPLEPVMISGGNGRASSAVELQLDELMDGNHVIAYHAADGDPGRPAVCGEIVNGG